MTEYGILQKRKLDPKVFASEIPDPKSDWEKDYVTWYRSARREYYEREGRSSELQTLERVKNWPNIPDATTKVCRTNELKLTPEAVPNRPRPLS